MFSLTPHWLRLLPEGRVQPIDRLTVLTVSTPVLFFVVAMLKVVDLWTWMCECLVSFRRIQTERKQVWHAIPIIFILLERSMLFFFVVNALFHEKFIFCALNFFLSTRSCSIMTITASCIDLKDDNKTGFGRTLLSIWFACVKSIVSCVFNVVSRAQYGFPPPPNLVWRPANQTVDQLTNHPTCHQVRLSASQLTN